LKDGKLRVAKHPFFDQLAGLSRRYSERRGQPCKSGVALHGGMGRYDQHRTVPSAILPGRERSGMMLMPGAHQGEQDVSIRPEAGWLGYALGLWLHGLRSLPASMRACMSAAEIRSVSASG
jgi:hypothetical protein